MAAQRDRTGRQAARANLTFGLSPCQVGRTRFLNLSPCASVPCTKNGVARSYLQEYESDVLHIDAYRYEVRHPPAQVSGITQLQRQSWPLRCLGSCRSELIGPNDLEPHLSCQSTGGWLDAPGNSDFCLKQPQFLGFMARTPARDRTEYQRFGLMPRLLMP